MSGITRSPQELNIAIVDDHPLTRFALRSLVEARPGWRVSRECETPQDLLDSLSSFMPDVVIIDLCFGEESGLDLLDTLSKKYPDIYSLVYSANPEREYAQVCLDRGANGYVAKEDPIENLQEAIQCVCNGYVYVSETLTQHIAHEISQLDSKRTG